MPINWKNISKNYKGKWVALKKDELSVIAVGESASEALDKARKSGYSNPILTKIPSEIISYIGNGLSI